MLQFLSGNDWLVSHFLPGDADDGVLINAMNTTPDPCGPCFIPAQVPGDVQSDAMDAGLIEDINYGYNARNAEWTYQRDWLYVKRFMPEPIPCKRIMLCFDGVDYACRVYLNGKWLGNHEIAWIPFRYDITDCLLPDRENVLTVLVEAAPDAECQSGYASRVRHLKARFAYGWDWCTRLVPLGIWKDVYIRYEQEAAIDDLHISSDTDYKTRRATIRAEAAIRGKANNTSVSFTLQHPNGAKETISAAVAEGMAHAEFHIEDAALWYPNGMGQQPLYTVSAVLAEDWDHRSANIGLRHIQWQRTEGAGEDALPYQPYINGRRVYLQGYNFTPIRQLYGRVHADVYRKRIELVKRAGANYLRVWGGGLLEREEFYDLCDRAGILVMQELFQSSAHNNNHPPRDPEYIRMMVTATEAAVIQKRNHPSLICWCGGNELCFRGHYMDAKGNILIDGAEGMEGQTYDVSKYHWVPVSPEYPTLAAMRDVVQRLDPDRMWLHTSGSGPITQNAGLEFLGGAMHDVHGPWTILGPTEQCTFYNALDMMIHHEFGSLGAASVQTIETVIPKKYRWPLDDTNPMFYYHGGRFYSNVKQLLEPYFGALDDYRSYALCARFIQWEQLRYALESHRRLGKRCAGSCLWHLAEPWPNLAETSTVDAWEQVRPAYYGQIAAFRPLHLSAHYNSVIHNGEFCVTLALHNAEAEDFAGSLQVQTFAPDGSLLESFYESCCAPADTVISTAAAFTFHNLPKGPFFLRQTLLSSDGRRLETGYSIHSTDPIPYAALLKQPECHIEAKLEDNLLVLKNTGAAVVSGLSLECDNHNSVFFSDGCIMLLPGEEARIQVEFSDSRPVPLYISGFGVPYQKLSNL